MPSASQPPPPKAASANHRVQRLLALIVFVALLAACGTPLPEQAAAPSPTTAPAASAPAPSAPVAPAPTGGAQGAEPTEATPAPAVQVTTAEGLPQGRTPEGYPVLGDPDAPVTLTMYSDFL